MRIWCKIKIKLLFDKFEYYCEPFARKLEYHRETLHVNKELIRQQSDCYFNFSTVLCLLCNEQYFCILLAA